MFSSWFTYDYNIVFIQLYNIAFSRLLKTYRNVYSSTQSIWTNNGSPRHGHVADIMRRTRAKYHYADNDNDNKIILLT